MSFWPFASEERPEKVGKTTIGVSLIQTRDIESQPVGLLILSDQFEPFDFVKDGDQILIGSRQEGRCPIRAILSVTETGGVVLREMAAEKAR